MLNTRNVNVLKKIIAQSNHASEWGVNAYSLLSNFISKNDHKELQFDLFAGLSKKDITKNLVLYTSAQSMFSTQLVFETMINPSARVVQHSSYKEMLGVVASENMDPGDIACMYFMALKHQLILKIKVKENLLAITQKNYLEFVKNKSEKLEDFAILPNPQSDYAFLYPELTEGSPSYPNSVMLPVLKNNNGEFVLMDPVGAMINSSRQADDKNIVPMLVGEVAIPFSKINQTYITIESKVRIQSTTRGDTKGKSLNGTYLRKCKDGKCKVKLDVCIGRQYKLKKLDKYGKILSNAGFNTNGEVVYNIEVDGKRFECTESELEIIFKVKKDYLKLLFCIQAAIATKNIEKDTVLLDAYSAIDYKDSESYNGCEDIIDFSQDSRFIELSD